MEYSYILDHQTWLKGEEIRRKMRESDWINSSMRVELQISNSPQFLRRSSFRSRDFHRSWC